MWAALETDLKHFSQVPSDGDFAFGQIHISHPKFIQCIDQVGMSGLQHRVFKIGV
jgi:hypothetical protein